MTNSLLIKAKTLLIEYLYELEKQQILDDIDMQSVEYLIDNIDYLLSGKIHIDYDVINVTLQDVLVTGSYHKNKKLLKVASILEEILKELPCTK